MTIKEKQTFIRLAPLLDFLEFSEENRRLTLDRPPFPLLVPFRLAEKMEKNNPSCPIFRQFVPQQDEKNTSGNFFKEPVQDPLFRLGGKLLQKYEGRSLILTTKACAMHCRYCFRQNFSYETEKKGFAEEIALLRKNRTLHEVILSGGDPLSLDNKALISLLDAIASIDHIQIVRFHTRTPIGHPERIDAELLDYLKTFPKKIIFILHINHPKELDREIISCFDRLRELKIPLLSQSVLLKGVNDSVETLRELSFALFQAGVLPYYLHQLDRVQGAIHFEVDRQEGLALIEELRASLPGYLVPKYVEEIPQKPSKTEILPL
ncbi:MAG: KamA family radical SAM protein [Chlamydiia bacterium]